MPSHQPAVLLKNWTCIRISGSGAEKLLQGQLTCDVTRLIPLQPQLGAYCNLQGKIEASFYLLKQQQDYWMLIAKDLQQITLETLKKYAVFFEVSLQACDYWIVGVWGDDASVSASPQMLSLPLMHDASRRFLISATTDVVNEDDSAWRLADIQQGIVHINAALTATYLPNVVNYHLNGAVDFKKGCYRGQEIVARVYYRGQLKQRLARVSATLPAVDIVQQVVYDGKHSDVLSQVNINDDWQGLVLLPADLLSNTSLWCGVNQQQASDWCFCVLGSTSASS